MHCADPKSKEELVEKSSRRARPSQIACYGCLGAIECVEFVWMLGLLSICLNRFARPGVSMGCWGVLHRPTRGGHAASGKRMIAYAVCPSEMGGLVG